jgi:hypothetical protein
MCANGVDLGRTCRFCGAPLLSCWDDGPSISWHADPDAAAACSAALLTSVAAGSG